MKGQFELFREVALLAGARTPWVDYCGPLAQVSPIDLGIHVARAVLARAGVAGGQVDSVLAGSMAQASFDAYMLPRHIGLYAGVPLEVPALAVQRICGTGLELLRQAGNQLERDSARLALCVATESMSRNPIASYEHRGGFRLGAPVGFRDFLWEALLDPAIGQTMIDTAQNLAQRYGLRREEVDAFALGSFRKALAAQASGWFDAEIARALALEPKLLLLDESFSGLRHEEIEMQEQLVRNTRQEGISILLIEHNMRVAMGLSDRLVVLDHGIKLTEGSPEEVRKNPDVIRAYLGKGGETHAA